MTDTPVAGGFIGLATLGRTPRPDFEKTFAPHLGRTPYRMTGALDGVSDEEAISLHSPDGEYPIHIPVAREGGIDVSRDRIRPYLQRSIDALVAEGAAAVAVLCAGDLGRFDCPVPLLAAGRLIPHMVQATLGTDVPLAVVTPNNGQVPFARRKWNEDGFEVDVVAVPPYAAREVRTMQLIAETTRMVGAGAGAVVLDCFGFGADDGRLVHRELGVPVFVAREVAGRAAGIFGLYLEPANDTTTHEEGKA
ncbi:AroM family protein [Microbacterium esteraromaticum]|uniref:AroM family protein n=1 Tax=Microbacterium esteraromaticum TaxID=57043 RepID=A0A7D8AJH4_9MICO|nr:AroM family protein [Microbacterium esteraromaticum]QMU95967.1 AroM family protein [Microbacterium esteraromaticum]